MIRLSGKNLSLMYTYVLFLKIPLGNVSINFLYLIVFHFNLKKKANLATVCANSLLVKHSIKLQSLD